MRYIIICLFVFLLCGCNSDNKADLENVDISIDNTPIIDCHIQSIDDNNRCDIYFEDGVVSKILFTSTFSNYDDVNDVKSELEAYFDNVLVNDLTISLEINSSNDKYSEYIGMDRESIGFICR